MVKTNVRKRRKKAISPLIAAVLLIAFTMAVAAILASWITGFSKSQTGYVGGKAENQIVCTYASLDADKGDVSYNFSTVPSTINVTVINSGSESLYNFTFIAKTNAGIYMFEPTNQYTKANPLKKGLATVLKAVNKSASPSSAETLKELKIRALCKDDYAIIHEISMT